MSKQKKLSLAFIIIVVAAVVIDQIIKIWVKTNMQLGEVIPIFGHWFNLHFIENEGMAFGLSFGENIGKLVLSLIRVGVVSFIIYYIIDNTGYKMAREGIWYVWQGIWLSSFVLFPLGAFLTYMAATDRTIELKSPKVLWKQFKEFLVRVRAKLQKKFYKAQPIEAGNEVDNKSDENS